MGYYTEFHFKAKLKEGSPKTLLKILNDAINDGEIGLGERIVMFDSDDVPTPAYIHPFFLCNRWFMLLMSNNWDDSLKSTFKDNILEINSEFKNYDNEIEKFIDLISPFVIGRKRKQFIGWSKGENHESSKINYYIYR